MDERPQAHGECTNGDHFDRKRVVSVAPFAFLVVIGIVIVLLMANDAVSAIPWAVAYLDCSDRLYGRLLGSTDPRPLRRAP